MELVFSALSWLEQTFLITKLHDVLEIFIVSFSLYHFCSWLHSDYTKPLLAYFYSYGYAVCFSYFFHLIPLYHILLFTAPIFFILLLIQHQKNLQKHFILQHNTALTPATIAKTDWLDSLVRSILIATHHNKSVTCIIEQRDSLDPLLTKPFSLGVHTQKELVDILLASDSYDSKKVMWITAQGTMISTNATWSEVITSELLFHQESAKTYPQQQAQLITQKTDALVFHISPETEQNFVAYQGKIIAHISVDQIASMLHAILTHKTIPFTFPQGKSYDTHKNSSF